MFTGCIRRLGLVDSFDGAYLQVRLPEGAPAISTGCSVCASGVRLTVQDVAGATIAAGTRLRSTFDSLTAGQPVNVEFPLTVGDALDGHLVQGYVDAVGKIARVDQEDGCLRAWIRPPERLLPKLVAKAPIAVDGVSVTIAQRLRDRFSVVILPVTRAASTLGQLAPGRRVNLELDLISRLVARRSRATSLDLPHVVSGLASAGHVSGRVGVQQAVSRLAAGGGVAVWDPDAESEGDVIFAGAQLRPGAFTFLLTEVCGHPTVPCAPEVLDGLGIGPIPGHGARHGTAFRTPVDLARGTGTGVSAAERAAVVRRASESGGVPGGLPEARTRL